MNDELKRQVALHSAGATVRHVGKFSELEVPSTMELPEQAFIDKWVIPFYRWKIRNPDEFLASYSPIRCEVSTDLCRTLLAVFNWRPRIVAAYFAAVEGFTELEDQIGRLFLRSDVCYAGRAYAMVLADFNTSSSIEFIESYLDYYLPQKDLHFDQASAIAALAYTDRRNGSKRVDRHLPAWRAFAGEDENRKFDMAATMLETDLECIERIKTHDTESCSRGIPIPSHHTTGSTES